MFGLFSKIGTKLEYKKGKKYQGKVSIVMVGLGVTFLILSALFMLTQ